MATHSSMLVWRIPMDRVAWQATVHGGHKRVRHDLVTKQLEEGIATHSSILAWRIPMDRVAWQTRVHGIAKRQT